MPIARERRTNCEGGLAGATTVVITVVMALIDIDAGMIRGEWAVTNDDDHHHQSSPLPATATAVIDDVVVINYDRTTPLARHSSV
jgi:hypothetical protein